ncbi:MAG: DEAD/DEAH box helicase family protein [Gammaproteobacteria bacterium]|nr:DEAD/DEAH box helicase family protein [Gammaproteobacteria bacterium]MBU1724016.1 DEAD/DEAH box helicase family protein [Gammaproteobacteria bacterium]MBU2006915.1 DEAD/DEAH box helicase family protein [Gammaproteobacteria bacterium]
MFELKNYQKETLQTLREFLEEARLMPVEEAFTRAQQRQNRQPLPYLHHTFGNVPYVCLRLPTGGGKTVLASYTVGVAKRAYLEQDFPIVLWLVPTNTIREQTLEALQKPGHPYRAALEDEFGVDRLLVLDIGDVTRIRKQDIGAKTIVVVGTLATLRVEDTSGRKVYAYHEDFEPHFAGVNPHDERLEKVTEADLKPNGLTAKSLGRIKYSFANLLALKQPLVIMDEAHNARTKLTFDTLKRIHPACVVEFTATPDASRESASNVLHHVSASQLKAANMIKLPIMLSEHNEWEGAVRDAVLTRKQLAQEAVKSGDSIRPLVLFQAENKSGEVTHEVLKTFLTEQLGVEPQQIAVVTGSQRELDGINLFDPACPIEYIITVEALKEGWDCSFAYVFCSVKDVKSAKDAEQLLGRVLRMPYAQRRQNEALNRAYAHLVSPNFAKAAAMLTDKMVQGMGFDPLEIPQHLQHGNQYGLFDGDVEQPKPAVAEERGEFTLSNGDTFTACGLIDEPTEKLILQGLSGKQKAEVQQQVEQHNLRAKARLAPAERGEMFASLPLLCVREENQLHLLEPESFLYTKGGWSLLDFPLELPQFDIRESGRTFEVFLQGGHVSYKLAEQNDTPNLNLIELDIDETVLVRWLDREVRQADVSPAEMIRWLVQLLGHLMKERGFSLTALVRSKFLLARAVKDRIAFCRNKAAQQGFRYWLFEDASLLDVSEIYRCAFKPGLYPARLPFYRGKYHFSKHYYPVIEDLSASGEEFTCAQVIDLHSNVRFWVRNLVNREASSFRLPLAHGYFYPDFVAELQDGRTLVVEYKGAHLETADDAREKAAVGTLWAEKSNNLFLLALAQDQQGRDVYQQLDNLLN